MGKAYLGHRIEPVDANDNVIPVGKTGELAAQRYDPPSFTRKINFTTLNRVGFIIVLFHNATHSRVV